MCELCDKYGEGNYWYLNPKSYARTMYKKPKEEDEPSLGMADFEIVTLPRHLKPMIDKKDESPEEFKSAVDGLSAIIQQVNPGQVIAVKDAKKIVEIAQPIAKINCICRFMTRATLEDRGHRSCLALGLGMLKWEIYPERYKGGIEFISVDEAKKHIDFWVKKGMVPTVMSFGKAIGGAPYIGGLCLCDYPDCLAIRAVNDYGVKMLFKGEYVAKVDYSKCNGCGLCIQKCQFGAIKKEVTINKINIDMFRCFGCGLCELACPKNAIQLIERSSFPALEDEW